VGGERELLLEVERLEQGEKIRWFRIDFLKEALAGFNFPDGFLERSGSFPDILMIFNS
jgi:hypothetical protein